MRRFGPLAPALLCGLVGAGLYLSVLTRSPGSLILMSMAQLPLFAAGLWLGVAAAAVAALASSAVMLATSGALSGALFAAVIAAPVALLVRQALVMRRDREGTPEWYPLGALTAWLTALGLAGVLIGIGAAGGRPGIESWLAQSLAPELARLPFGSAADRQQAIHSLALVLPGILTLSWMAMVATNGVLAQGVLARFEVARRPAADIASLTLPLWVPLVFLAGAIATAFDGMPRLVGINVLILMLMPFCLEGLAVVHRAARRLSRPMAVLVVVYVVAGLFGWPLLVIALLGLVDASLAIGRHLRGRSFGGRIDG